MSSTEHDDREAIEQSQQNSELDQDPKKIQIHADSELISLFTKTQRRLYLFILHSTGNPDQAEEILQETNVVILTKMDQFQRGTNFYAWVCQIAHYEILKFRQRKQRSKLVFSDEFLQHIVAATIVQDDGLSELKQKALRSCLEKLRPRDREIIENRYNPDISTQELSERLHRPANSIYQSIGRIRKTLLECIRREMNLEQFPNPS